MNIDNDYNINNIVNNGRVNSSIENEGSRNKNNNVNIDFDLLRVEDISLLQLGDSFFPTGMYTTSNGLEALFYDKKIRKKDEILDFITVCLKYQIGPADCTALANAYEYAKVPDFAKIIDIDKILFSMKLVKEVRDASARSGTQLLNCVLSFLKENDLVSSYYNSIRDKKCHGIYPVALGVVSNALRIKKEHASMLLLYGYTISIVGAALRLGMLQHFEGQQIIHELKPVMLETIHSNINRSVSHMWQFTPDIDLIQIKHEGMDSKMFIT